MWEVKIVSRSFLNELSDSVTIAEDASDADVVGMVIKALLGAQIIRSPEELRDRLIDDYPVEDKDPWEEIELELIDAEEPEPVSPCDGCEETCEDTACLKREDYDY